MTKDNFVQGCTGRRHGHDAGLGQPVHCLYNVTTASIPASASDKKTRGGGKTFATYNGKTFIQINDELKNDPNSLPSSLTDAFKENCPGFEGDHHDGQAVEQRWTHDGQAQVVARGPADASTAVGVGAIRLAQALALTFGSGSPTRTAGLAHAGQRSRLRLGQLAHEGDGGRILVGRARR